MEFNLELNNLNCQKENHNSAQIVGFCIDEKCKEINRFACLDCLFEVHPQHKLVKIKELNEFILNKYKNFKKSLENDKKIIEINKKNESNQEKKLEELKKIIFNDIEGKINIFTIELKKKYSELNNDNNKDFSFLKEYENFISNNAAPTTKLELTKLSEICTKLYKGSHSEEEFGQVKGIEDNEKQKGIDRGENIQQYNEKKIIKNNLILDNFNKEFDEFIKKQSSLITQYINENFLKVPENFFSNSPKFEWCNKTYCGYDFFYELSKNNKKAIKILSNGTMTILRAKEELKDNFKYKIKFIVGLKNGGDFDIGIGTEKVGDSCWLRTKESLCISNAGILNLDIIMDNSVRIKDNDIVDIEISTEENKKYFKANLNNNLICILDFYLKNVFIMAAIRNIGNYIEVIEYEACSIL